MEKLRVLELYSGIGGMHAGLKCKIKKINIRFFSV